MKSLRHTLLTVVLLLVSLRAAAYMYGTTGLSSGLITAMAQDAEGWLWTGTEYGLNKFDGYTFTPYLHHRGDEKSLPASEISALYVSKNGGLYVGTAKGLARYERADDSFKVYRFPDNRQPRVTKISEHGGRIVVSTAGYGFYSLDPNAEHADYEGRWNKAMDNHFINVFAFDKTGALWHGGEMGEALYRTSQRRGRFHTECLPLRLGKPIEMFPLKGGGILTVMERGIVLAAGLGRATAQALPIDYNGYGNFTAAALDRGGTLYLATKGAGLCTLKRGSRRLEPLYVRERGTDLLQASITRLLEDSEGNIWASCYNKGLLRIGKGREAFWSHSFQEAGIRTGAAVTSVAEYGTGVLLTLYRGNIYNVSKDGVFTPIPASVSGLRLVYKDLSGHYWLGTETALLAFDPKTGKTEKVAPVQGKGVKAITSDGERLYVSAFGAGLGIYDLRSHKWKTRSMKEKDPQRGSLLNDWINALLLDKQKRLWLATTNGVAVMDTGTGSFQSFTKKPILEGRQCYALCQTASGDMLISTDEGLWLYCLKSRRAKPVRAGESLTAQHIVSMASDGEGGIWLGTRSGIWQLSPDLRHATRHTDMSGEGIREYVSSAALTMADGSLCFAFGGGVTLFRPEAVKAPEKARRQVRLTGITAGGKWLNPMQRAYVLDYGDNTVRLSFSTFSFQDIGSTVYRWRINGSRTWQTTESGSNSITLSALQPGDYLLEIAASGGKPLVLKITVQKPWYATPWAWLVYILTGGGLVFLILFNIDRQRKRNMEEMKMQFLINATHDIRTPLTLIMGVLGRLKERAKQKEDQYDIEQIDKNAGKLLLLVNQILDERRIDKRQMLLKCQATELNGFIRNIALLYLSGLRERRIELVFDFQKADIEVFIDRVNFDKVVSNLLSNAMKFTPEGGKIEIKTRKEKGKNAIFEVLDTGPGFPADDTERLFERFYQSPKNHEKGAGGWGIGLNLSKNIVSLHGGTITAYNRQDGVTGALLRVSLPLGKEHLKEQEILEEKEPAPTLPVGKRTKSQKRILIVDDAPEIGQYIAQELSPYYRFDWAENGREALKRLLDRDYGLVISDVMMPVMDGLALLKNIRQNPNISFIPVILLTSKAELGNRLEGLQAGADGYLAKPFKMEELHALIDNLLSQRQRLKGTFSGEVEQLKRRRNITVKGNNDALMDKIMQAVNQHLADSDLTIERITQEVGISRTQLHRKMKEITGLSATEFIRNQRIEQAARLIREQQINITQVAYSVGFNNQAHFSTVFKRYFGLTPTQYAEKHGSNAPTED